MWRRLEHENIVPFLGVVATPPQLISEWMSGGELTEYIGKHMDANRLGLVGVTPMMLVLVLILLRYAISPKVFTTFTPAT